MTTTPPIATFPYGLCQDLASDRELKTFFDNLASSLTLGNLFLAMDWIITTKTTAVVITFRIYVLCQDFMTLCIQLTHYLYET